MALVGASRKSVDMNDPEHLIQEAVALHNATISLEPIGDERHRVNGLLYIGEVIGTLHERARLMKLNPDLKS